jgi:hypothetical protein
MAINPLSASVARSPGIGDATKTQAPEADKPFGSALLGVDSKWRGVPTVKTDTLVGILNPGEAQKAIGEAVSQLRLPQMQE